MAFVSCPACGKPLSNDDAVLNSCTNCGCVFTQEQRQHNRKIVIENLKAKAAFERKCNRDHSSTFGSFFIIVAFVGFMSFLLWPTDKASNPHDSQRPVVENSAWDASVHQVVSWLRENLKDPDSLKFFEWSPVQKTNGGYMVRAKYRAKNSFGGYVVENKIFVLDSSGRVISTY